MREKFAAVLWITGAVLFLAAVSAAYANDGRLIGTWAWEREEYDNEDGTERGYSLTLTFGADGVIKMEPFYYDHGADTAYGNYKADGETLNVVITKIEPFFADEGSAYFEVGETINERYMLLGGNRMVMKFLGGVMIFKRIKYTVPDEAAPAIKPGFYALPDGVMEGGFELRKAGDAYEAHINLAQADLPHVADFEFGGVLEIGTMPESKVWITAAPARPGFSVESIYG
ncbi:MAG: lipocalin family protein [Synergistaceae bacterium]|jgi:hypothetical protein|nr:lipocalin family protein [Synergistaceae bacterium]